MSLGIGMFGGACVMALGRKGGTGSRNCLALIVQIVDEGVV